MREACPWQRTGGVVDHQMTHVVLRDAGLGKGLAPATRNARKEEFFVSPAKAGVQSLPLA
jgi:hypothetical protein